MKASGLENGDGARRMLLPSSHSSILNVAGLVEGGDKNASMSLYEYHRTLADRLPDRSGFFRAHEAVGSLPALRVQ